MIISLKYELAQAERFLKDSNPKNEWEEKKKLHLPGKIKTLKRTIIELTAYNIAVHGKSYET